MKIILTTIFLFLNSVSNAEDSKFFINTFDPEFDGSQLKSPETKVTQGVEESKGSLMNLQSPEKMEQFFKQTQLSHDMSKLEQISKDIFCLKVKGRDPAAVHKDYPSIPEEKIRRLKKLLEAE